MITFVDGLRLISAFLVGFATCFCLDRWATAHSSSKLLVLAMSALPAGMAIGFWIAAAKYAA